MFRPFANFAPFLIASKTAYPSSDPISKKDLSLILGTKQTFECHDVPFEVFVPYETRINDSLVIKNILGNLTLKIKFKEKNE